MSTTEGSAGLSHSLVTPDIVGPEDVDYYAQKYFPDAFETLRNRIHCDPSLTPQVHYNANTATIFLGLVHASQRSVFAEFKTEDSKFRINTAIGTDLNPYAQLISASFNELTQTTYLPAFSGSRGTV
jgi:hypothetical protein